MRINNSEIEKIRNNIRHLAELFDLRYKKSLYKICFLTKPEITILNFLTGCPEPRYARFGEKLIERAKRIDEFLQSEEFEYLSKERGGCVANIKTFESSIKNLKNRKTNIVCKDILRKLKASSFGKNAIVVTIPENKKEKQFVLNTIIFHEWIHTILFYNKINFQRIKKEYWKLDEGLTEYAQTFFKTGNSDISKIIKRKIKMNRSAFYKNYLENALKFNRILKGKKEPQERRKAVLNYLNRMKVK